MNYMDQPLDLWYSASMSWCAIQLLCKSWSEENEYQTPINTKNGRNKYKFGGINAQIYAPITNKKGWKRGHQV